MLILQLYNYLFGKHADINAYINAKLNGAKENIKSPAMLDKVITRIQNEKNVIQNELKSKFKSCIENKNFRRDIRILGASDLEDALYGNHEDMLEESTNTEWNIIEDRKIFSDINIFYLCDMIANYFECNNDESHSLSIDHAKKIEMLFGKETTIETVNLFVSYLNAHNFCHKDKPVHDALLYPTLHNVDIIKIKDSGVLAFWQALILKKGHRAAKLFNLAEKIQEKLGRTPDSFEEAVLIAKELTYVNSHKYPELSDLCMQYNISESLFNRCLAIDEKRKTKDNLPDITIDGAQYGHPGYYFVKLPINDPRAYLLGYITGCCQSIGGHSEECVRDGITRENNGFYVLMKSKKKNHCLSPHLDDDKLDYQNFDLIGQGYVWLSVENNLVFDSWENLRNQDNPVLVELIMEFSRRVTSNFNILKVLIGRGGNTPQELLGEDKHHAAESMLEGRQYADSRAQALIYVNQDKQNFYINDLTERCADIINLPDGTLKCLAYFSRFGINSYLEYSHLLNLIQRPYVTGRILKDILSERSEKQKERGYSKKDKFALKVFKSLSKNNQMKMIREDYENKTYYYSYSVVNSILPCLIMSNEFELASSIFHGRIFSDNSFTVGSYFNLIHSLTFEQNYKLFTHIIGKENFGAFIEYDFKNISIIFSILKRKNGNSWFDMLDAMFTEEGFRWIVNHNYSSFYVSDFKIFLPPNEAESYYRKWIDSDTFKSMARKNRLGVLEFLEKIHDPIGYIFEIYNTNYFMEHIDSMHRMADFFNYAAYLFKTTDDIQRTLERIGILDRLSNLLGNVSSALWFIQKLPENLRLLFLKMKAVISHINALFHSMYSAEERFHLFSGFLETLNSNERIDFIENGIDYEILLSMILFKNIELKLNLSPIRRLLPVLDDDYFIKHLLRINVEGRSDEDIKFQLALIFLAHNVKKVSSNEAYALLGQAANHFHGSMLHAYNTNPCSKTDLNNMAFIVFDVAKEILHPVRYPFPLGFLRNHPIRFGSENLKKIIIGSLCVFLGAALMASAIALSLISFGVLAPISIAAITIGANTMIGGISVATAAVLSGLTIGACLFAISGRKHGLAKETENLLEAIPHLAGI